MVRENIAAMSVGPKKDEIRSGGCGGDGSSVVVVTACFRASLTFAAYAASGAEPHRRALYLYARLGLEGLLLVLLL